MPTSNIVALCVCIGMCLVAVGTVVGVWAVATSRATSHVTRPFSESQSIMVDLGSDSSHSQINTIPAVLWATGPFAAKDLPRDFQKALDTWRNMLHVSIQYHDNAQAEAFVAREFPQYLPEYQVLIPGAFKADLWRLLVLLKHGGVYADVGVHVVSQASPQPLRDFAQGLVHASLFMVDDDHPTFPGSVFQGVLAAVPGHPVIQHMVARVVANIRGRVYGAHALDITGPRAVGPAAIEALGAAAAKMRSSNGKWLPGLYDIGGSIGTVLIARYKGRRVVDGSENTLFRTKVPGYYTTMYKNNKKAHYYELWRTRQVYRK